MLTSRGWQIIKNCIGDFSWSQNSKFTRIIKLKLKYLVSAQNSHSCLKFSLLFNKFWIFLIIILFLENQITTGARILSKIKQSKLKLLQQQENTLRNKVRIKLKLYYSCKCQVLRSTKISNTFLYNSQWRDVSISLSHLKAWAAWG